MRLSSIAGFIVVLLWVAPGLQSQEGADTAGTVVYQGTFVGVEGHEAGGGFAIIKRGDNWYARTLEDFTSQKVPDGHVYFSDDPLAIDGNSVYVSPLHRRVGIDEYELPEGVDPGSFKYLIIWCGRFDVGVAAGEMAQVSEDE